MVIYSGITEEDIALLQIDSDSLNINLPHPKTTWVECFS